MKKIAYPLSRILSALILLPVLLPLGSIVSTPVVSAAEFSTPTFGGGGGSRSYNLDCGAGSVMVGLIHQSGSWIDAIGVVCRKVNSSTGALGEEFTRGPKGGVGGVAKISKCYSGGVIGSAGAHYGQFVNYLFLGCYQWDAPRKRLGSPQQVKDHDRQNFAVAGSFCSVFCKQSSHFTCPSGKAGKALRGRYGGYVDSTRFVCDDWNQ